MKIFSFPSGGYVDEIANNETLSWIQITYVLPYNTLTAIHFMNGQGVP